MVLATMSLTTLTCVLQRDVRVEARGLQDGVEMFIHTSVSTLVSTLRLVVGNVAQLCHR